MIYKCQQNVKGKMCKQQSREKKCAKKRNEFQITIKKISLKFQTKIYTYASGFSLTFFLSYMFCVMNIVRQSFYFNLRSNLFILCCLFVIVVYKYFYIEVASKNSLKGI